jgi:hypothetical protein
VPAQLGQLLAGVQVHPCGPGGGVAHPVHQLSQRGARLTGEGVAGMTEIVNMNLSWLSSFGQLA